MTLVDDIRARFKHAQAEVGLGEPSSGCRRHRTTTAKSEVGNGKIDNEELSFLPSLLPAMPFQQYLPQLSQGRQRRRTQRGSQQQQPQQQQTTTKKNQNTLTRKQPPQPPQQPSHLEAAFPCLTQRLEGWDTPPDSDNELSSMPLLPPTTMAAATPTAGKAAAATAAARVLVKEANISASLMQSWDLLTKASQSHSFGFSSLQQQPQCPVVQRPGWEFASSPVGSGGGVQGQLDGPRGFNMPPQHGPTSPSMVPIMEEGDFDSMAMTNPDLLAVVDRVFGLTPPNSPVPFEQPERVAAVGQAKAFEMLTKTNRAADTSTFEKHNLVWNTETTAPPSSFTHFSSLSTSSAFATISAPAPTRIDIANSNNKRPRFEMFEDHAAKKFARGGDKQPMSELVIIG